jgi:hypothetical protein
MSFFLLITRCATLGPQSFSSTLPEESRREIRTIAVLPSQDIPKNNFLTYSKDRNTGAVQEVVCNFRDDWTKLGEKEFAIDEAGLSRSGYK